MFKRSLLSLMLVASLVCPAAAQAGWKESAQSNWSDFSGAVSAVLTPSTYTKAFRDVRGAYKGFNPFVFYEGQSNELLASLSLLDVKSDWEHNQGGLKAAGQALMQNKHAIAGAAVLTVAALVASYFAYNKWNTTTSTTE